jgi:hypothetical protein
MTTLLEAHNTRRDAWVAKINAAYGDKKRAAADVQRLKRDAIAIRLAIADAQINHADCERRIEEIRKTKPQKPEPR